MRNSLTENARMAFRWKIEDFVSFGFLSCGLCLRQNLPLDRGINLGEGDEWNLAKFVNWLSDRN